MTPQQYAAVVNMISAGSGAYVPGYAETRKSTPAPIGTAPLMPKSKESSNPFDLL